MNPQQAISAKAHLNVLRDRLLTLKGELEIALREEEQIDGELEMFRVKGEQTFKENAQKKEELEANYINELQECQKQNRLAEDMLEKKKEERQSLLEYLYGLNLCQRSNDDVKNFDWVSMRKMVMLETKSEVLDENHKKLFFLTSLNQQAKAQLNDIFGLFKSTQLVKQRAKSKIEEIKEFVALWKKTKDEQEKKILKMQNDNERLNLLIKQCASNNEPISDFVTQNVRAKCQSFLHSRCPKELYNGLSKYRTRQDRIIKLLKHKENKLSRDTNLLKMATEQIVDHMQYYLNIINSNYHLSGTSALAIPH